MLFRYKKRTPIASGIELGGRNNIQQQQLFLSYQNLLRPKISYMREKWEFTHSCRDDDSIIFFRTPRKNEMKFSKIVTRKKRKLFGCGETLKKKDVDSFVHFLPIHTHTQNGRKKRVYALLRRYVCVCVCVSWRSQMKERPPWVPPFH